MRGSAAGVIVRAEGTDLKGRRARGGGEQVRGRSYASMSSRYPCRNRVRGKISLLLPSWVCSKISHENWCILLTSCPDQCQIGTQRQFGNSLKLLTLWLTEILLHPIRFLEKYTWWQIGISQLDCKVTGFSVKKWQILLLPCCFSRLLSEN